MRAQADQLGGRAGEGGRAACLNASASRLLIPNSDAGVERTEGHAVLLQPLAVELDGVRQDVAAEPGYLLERDGGQVGDGGRYLLGVFW